MPVCFTCLILATVCALPCCGFTIQSEETKWGDYKVQFIVIHNFKNIYMENQKLLDCSETISAAALKCTMISCAKLQFDSRQTSLGIGTGCVHTDFLKAPFKQIHLFSSVWQFGFKQSICLTQVLTFPNWTEYIHRQTAKLEMKWINSA